VAGHAPQPAIERWLWLNLLDGEGVIAAMLVASRPPRTARSDSGRSLPGAAVMRSMLASEAEQGSSPRCNAAMAAAQSIQAPDWRPSWVVTGWTN
jgi:hypothetical protein